LGMCGIYLIIPLSSFTYVEEERQFHHGEACFELRHLLRIAMILLKTFFL
jgi:hypothetical protein